RPADDEARARIMREQAQAKPHRVDALRARNLVDERLAGEFRVASPDATPEANVVAALLAEQLLELVVTGVANLVPLGDRLIPPFELAVRCGIGAGVEAGGHDAVPPGDQISLFVEAGLEVLARERPELVVFQVVLPAPHDLDRFAGGLGKQDSVDALILLDAPAEAAAEIGDLDCDLVGRRLEDIRHRELSEAGRLGGQPQLSRRAVAP